MSERKPAIYWLENRCSDYYLRILALLDRYDHGNLTIREFLSELDVALDIWQLAPENWSDPYLLRVAAFLDIYAKPYLRLDSDFSEEDKREITLMIREIRDQAINVHIHSHLRGILSAIAAYEQGRMQPGVLVSSLWAAVYALDGMVPIELWAELQAYVVSMEGIIDVYYATSGDKSDRVTTLRKLLAEEIESMKLMLNEHLSSM